MGLGEEDGKVQLLRKYFGGLIFASGKGRAIAEYIVEADVSSYFFGSTGKELISARLKQSL